MDATKDVVTDNGVLYTVSDEGQALVADNSDVADHDDATVPVLRGSGTDADCGDVVEVPSILIPADIVVNVKMKSVSAMSSYSL